MFPSSTTTTNDYERLHGGALIFERRNQLLCEQASLADKCEFLLKAVSDLTGANDAIQERNAQLRDFAQSLILTGLSSQQPSPGLPIPRPSPRQPYPQDQLHQFQAHLATLGKKSATLRTSVLLPPPPKALPTAAAQKQRHPNPPAKFPKTEPKTHMLELVRNSATMASSIPAIPERVLPLGPSNIPPQVANVANAAVHIFAAAAAPPTLTRTTPLTSAEITFFSGGTTLVVRNIPARYSQEKLIEEWKLGERCNLLYLPFSFKARRTLGYAFVNFLSEEAANGFAAIWSQARMHDHGAVRPLQVTLHTTQGFWENVAVLQDCKLGRSSNDKMRYLGPRVFTRTGEQLGLRAFLELARPAPTPSRQEQAQEAPSADALADALAAEHEHDSDEFEQRRQCSSSSASAGVSIGAAAPAPSPDGQ